MARNHDMKNKPITRDNYVYVGIRKEFAKVIDTCVSSILLSGEQKYVDRKDFVIKSIQNQIDSEKENNSNLQKVLKKLDSEIFQVVYAKN